MRGLKIVPFFLLLSVLTYTGMQFVEANRDEVTITLGGWHSQTTPVGFVVLTSILIGMAVCGALCSIELLGLYVQNRRLKRKLQALESTQRLNTPANPPTDLAVARSSGRFS